MQISMSRNCGRGVVLAVGAAVFTLFSGTVGAAPITVLNSSFETPDLADGAFTADFSGVPGFTATANSGIQDSDNSKYAGTTGAGNLPAPADAQQFAYVFQGSSVTSNSLGAFAAGTTFTFTIAVGVALNQSADVGKPYALNLLNGATSFASVAGTAPLTAGTFQNGVLSFTNPVAVTNLAVRFTNTATAGQLNIDNVRVDAVPEPTSLGLLGLGTAGMTMPRRRRV